MEKTFLGFLNGILPDAAFCAKKMEENFFTDPSSAIAKARVYIEEVINSIWKIENLSAYDYNLYERINYLYDQEYLNTNIYQSFDVIRRAGNKAAHDAKFNDMRLAYSVHKEMYQIAIWYVEIYTHKEIMFPPYEQPIPSAKLAISDDLLEERMKSMLASIIKNKIPDEHTELSDEDQGNKQAIALERMNGSYLEREISRLRISSAEAVENAQSFSEFKQYLHVTRPIQEKVEEVLSKRVSEDTSNLILLCGSVGDGKSHLLAYLNQQRKDLMAKYKVFNDATESFSPSKTALETLEEVLKNFSDQHFDETKEKTIIAINLGVLHNFIYREHEHFTYEKLKRFVEDSQLFSPQILTHCREGVFDIVSFADYQMYEISPSGVESSYFKSLIEKVCAPTKDNPFHMAYAKDVEEGNHSIIHENYRFLSNEFVQKQIVSLVIQAMICFKISVSSRHFLSFIADLLIPKDFNPSEIENEYNLLSQTLPSILFNSKDRSQLLDTISRLNPIHSRKNAIDELLVTLNTLTDWKTLIDNKVVDEVAKGWLMPFASEADLIKGAFEVFVDGLIAILYLTDEAFVKEIEDPIYTSYIEYMYSFNKLQPKKVKDFYKNLRSAIFSWKGSPLTDYIVINRLENELATVQKLKLHPQTDHLSERNEIKLQSFKPVITVKYADEHIGEVVLEIDFALFQLLSKVSNGYRPNKKDEEEATTFIEFLEKIMAFGDKKEEMVFDFIAENKKYRLKLDEFQSYVFEKVE